MSQKFQRRKENFICQHCSVLVRGNGYTNHCPHCLWSRHVDVHPGDRQASCGGMMAPVGLTLKNSAYSILHCCVTCGFENKNKAAKADNSDMLVKLSA